MTPPFYQPVRIPPRGSSAYLAAEFLHQFGPKSEADLFSAVSFGDRPSARLSRLQATLAEGWLVVVDGLIQCSHAAIAHLDEQPEPPAAYVGIPAAPRDLGSVYDRPSLNRKYMPNSKGMRADIPAWSVRGRVTFFTA